jgi:ATP-dependent RNA helicase DBP3
MSNDTTVPDVNVAKVSKKDKKSKKNKDVAVDASAAPVVDAGKKKEKKDKKRKAEADVDADAEVEGASTADPSLLTKSDGDKKQKKKKQKTLPVAESAGDVEVVVSDAVGNTSSAMQVDEPETVAASGEKKEKKSKKEKKEKKSKKSSGSNVNDNDVPGEGTSSSSVTPANLTAALASTADSKAYLEKHNITLTPDIYNILLNFSTLPINPALRPYLASFTDPTPIQACSWPPLFQGKDVVGIAETGSGKTLSFGLPGLNVLSTTSSPVDAKGKGRDAGKIRLLVVAPTRELATQTYTTLLALGKLVGIGAVCLYGGVGKDEQIRELRKKETAIVVGTPGRVMDLADSGDVDFSG